MERLLDAFGAVAVFAAPVAFLYIVRGLGG
jgi:hypothetical protein